MLWRAHERARTRRAKPRACALGQWTKYAVGKYCQSHLWRTRAVEGNATATDDRLVDSTADIVAAYVTRNSVSPADIPRLIGEVHGSLLKLLEPATPAPEGPREPAVSIRRSITPEALVCIDCGKKFRTLKRHLNTEHGLTPDQYRDRWHLPTDYPVVAPNYSERRSTMAKNIGLGRAKAAPRGRGKAKP
jgi:predicted transcriptional regulator